MSPGFARGVRGTPHLFDPEVKVISAPLGGITISLSAMLLVGIVQSFFN